jgi:hypothetical protein
MSAKVTVTLLAVAPWEMQQQIVLLLFTVKEMVLFDVILPKEPR